MTAVAETENIAHLTGEVEFTTFYVNDILIGVDILQVQEINKQVLITEVPHAERCVRGVVNLRGEVITVVDLRIILGLEPATIGTDTRIVVLSVDGEKIGLLADKVADVVDTTWSNISATPANVKGVDERFFKGVCRLEKELLVILNVEEVFSGETIVSE